MKFCGVAAVAVFAAAGAVEGAPRGGRRNNNGGNNNNSSKQPVRPMPNAGIRNPFRPQPPPERMDSGNGNTQITRPNRPGPIRPGPIRPGPYGAFRPSANSAMNGFGSRPGPHNRPTGSHPNIAHPIDSAMNGFASRPNPGNIDAMLAGLQTLQNFQAMNLYNNNGSNEDEVTDEQINDFNSSAEQTLAEIAHASMGAVVDRIENTPQLITESEVTDEDTGSLDMSEIEDLKVTIKSGLGSSNKCSAPKSNTGWCRAMIRKWTYNSKTNKCERFTYGGCTDIVDGVTEGLTENVFSNEAECQSECVDPNVVLKTSMKKFGGFVGSQSQNSNPSGDPCLDPTLIMGWCRIYSPTWTFNAETGECNQLSNDGCGQMETMNKFTSEEQCRGQCIDNTQARTFAETAIEQGFSMNDLLNNAATFNNFDLNSCGTDPCKCLVDEGWGPKKQHTDKFYFEPVTKSCETFTFRGYGGNNNKFNTLTECQNTCEEGPQIFGRGGLGAFGSSSGNNDGFGSLGSFGGLGGLGGFGFNNSPSSNGNLPTNPCDDKMVEIGFCRAMIYYYNFNKATGKCEQAVFGGCSGSTQNEFNTIEECQDVCESTNSEETSSDNSNDSDTDSDDLYTPESRCFGAFDRSDVNDNIMSLAENFLGTANLNVFTYFVFDLEKDRCKQVKYFTEKSEAALENENLFHKFGHCMQSCRKLAYEANAARRAGDRK